MKINWKLRLQNKLFWTTLIPMILLLVQAVAALFGYTLDLSELSGKLILIVDIIFGILVTIGIVADPTTEGISDSDLAMTYTKPKR